MSEGKKSFAEECEEYTSYTANMETFKEVLAKELHNLDLFNLEVAKVRSIYGLSPQMLGLYGIMGVLSRELMHLEPRLREIEGLWQRIVISFRGLEEDELTNQEESK